MKKILIMGGTRFVGKRLVKLFSERGFSITISSRRVIENFQGLTQLTGEREETIKMLRGLKFDVVIDFTAYTHSAVSEFFTNIVCTRYILISSSWVSQFQSGGRVFDSNQQQYINGKLDIENFLSDCSNKSTNFTIVRFPIILGVGDVSGRLDYLASRLYQKRPIILPNGGVNKTKFCYADDAALLLSAISDSPEENSCEVLDCLPEESISILSLVKIMGDILSVAPRIINISLDEILKVAPEFLDVDPFYQETRYTTQSINIFKKFGIKPRFYNEWVRECLHFYNPDCGNLKKTMKSYKWDEKKFRETERILVNAYTH